MGESPSEKGKGVHQGSTDNKGAHHNNVVTGNVSGYNVITGVLNITVESATTLTDTIRGFTARVATASLRLKLVGDKVSTTSTVLTRISDLVVKQAERENITRKKDEDQNNASMDQGGKVDSALHNLYGDSDVLKWRCFMDMKEASQGARSSFQHFTQKINDASKALLQLDGHTEGQPNRSKVELTEVQREKLFLRERDIDIMENEIESHKIELQLTFTVFQAVLTEGMKRIMLDMYKTMRFLVDEITQTSQSRTNPGLPVKKIGQSTDQPNVPTTRPDLQPINSLENYRLVHLYMGWIFTKAQPPGSYHDSSPRSRGSSWEYSIPYQMAVSAEELYLLVLRQISQRSKLDRTLWDDYQTLRRSRRKRVLLENLLRDQNLILQRKYPELEWKVAGLAFTVSKSHKLAQDLKTIQVILKTQYAPESQRGTPRISGEAQKPDGTVAGGVLAGDVSISPNGDRGGRGDATGSGSTKRASHDQNGGDGTPVSNEPVYVQPHAPYRPQHGSAKGGQGVELHQPQLVFVKERKRGNQDKDVKEKGIHWWWSRANWRGSQVYVELRDSGSTIKKRGHGNDSGSPPRGRFSSQGGLGLGSPSTLRHSSASNIQFNTLSRSGPGHDRINDALINMYEMTSIEEERVIEELFDEWDELVDRIRKKGKRSRRHYGNVDARGGDSSVGVSRRLMRRVEQQSRNRIREEIRLKEEIRIAERVRMTEKMMTRADARLRMMEPQRPARYITERFGG
ncbi:hypothetical protein RRF57_004593 [Xylaria bambusicola]|uniref:Uncharacterized protein n=1 Tax=Xylaria bambusicola TaxID=326684 RepID=A0AAN7UJH0_9PEZI